MPYEREVKRQIVHIFLGIVILFLINNLERNLSVGILFAGLIFGSIVFYLSIKRSVPIISSVLNEFERKGVFPGKGSLYFVLGSLISIIFFPLNIASASIIILALGDGFATLIGLHGKIKHPHNIRKTVEGSLAGFILALIGSSAFVPVENAIIAAIIFVIVESLEIRIKKVKLDDNLLIPIFCSIILQILAV